MAIQQKAVSYARVSNRNQMNRPQKVTIFIRTGAHPHADMALAVQKEKVMNYCKSNGHEVVGAITVQGSSELAMYELRRLAANPGETELLVTSSLDCLTRKPDELLEIKSLMDSCSIGVKIIDDTDVFFDLTASMVSAINPYTPKFGVIEEDDADFAEGESTTPILSI